METEYTQTQSMTKSKNTTISPKTTGSSEQPFYSSDESSDDDMSDRHDDNNGIGDDVTNTRRYPLRNRTQRNFEADGYIPWDLLEHRF